MINEKVFKFNPFNIKNWHDEEVKEQYDLLVEQLVDDDGTTFSLAHNIDTYANMGYLIGEMVARYYELVNVADAQIKTKIANQIVLQRKQWLKDSPDKAPAMSYFENMARSMFESEQIDIIRMEANLKRFKIAYDSIETKGNALKKKMESLKFDTFGRN